MKLLPHHPNVDTSCILSDFFESVQELIPYGIYPDYNCSFLQDVFTFVTRDSLKSLRLSKHFNLYECLSRSFNDTESAFDFPLLGVPYASFLNMAFLVYYLLEPVREVLPYPIFINSFFRSELHNSSVNGVLSSNHLTGRAVDVRASNLDELETTLRQRCDFLLYEGIIDNYEFLRYPNFIHVAI